MQPAEIKKATSAQDWFSAMAVVGKPMSRTEQSKQMRECAAKSICTFSVTGKDYQFQDWYICHTCSGNNIQQGLCEACLKVNPVHFSSSASSFSPPFSD